MPFLAADPFTSLFTRLHAAVPSAWKTEMKLPTGQRVEVVAAPRDTGNRLDQTGGGVETSVISSFQCPLSALPPGWHLTASGQTVEIIHGPLASQTLTLRIGIISVDGGHATIHCADPDA